MLIVITILIYFAALYIFSRLTNKSSDNDTFFRGNSRSPWYMVAFGMVGASISGVTFVSVPGMVTKIDMTYLQTCLGFILGYLAVAFFLLPVYYRHNLTTIYSYLGSRLGETSYKTGAWFYTRRGGIKTLVWTDTFQTTCLFTALLLIIYNVASELGLSFGEAVCAVAENPMSRIFEFDDIRSTQYFWKQFLSGIFIVIVMTGLDQDMMQKNLTCKTLREAQKDMATYGVAFVPANLLFMALGVLLVMLAQVKGVALPAQGDELLPMFAASGQLGQLVVVLFTIGIVAASFSSADSALTSLTTCCCVDICQRPSDELLRRRVHLGLSVLFVVFILLFRAINSTSVIDAIYIMCSYTYGPLLGLFAFALLTRRKPIGRMVPFVAVLSPCICYAIDRSAQTLWDYRFGYELLMLNGFLTFLGLWLGSRKVSLL